MQLACEADAIGLIARLQLGIEAMGWPEEGDSQRFAVALEAMAQCGQRPMAVEPFAERLQYPSSGLLAVQCFQLASELRLGVANEG